MFTVRGRYDRCTLAAPADADKKRSDRHTPLTAGKNVACLQNHKRKMERYDGGVSASGTTRAALFAETAVPHVPHSLA